MGIQSLTGKSEEVWSPNDSKSWMPDPAALAFSLPRVRFFFELLMQQSATPWINFKESCFVKTCHPMSHWENVCWLCQLYSFMWTYISATFETKSPLGTAAGHVVNLSNSHLGPFRIKQSDSHIVENQEVFIERIYQLKSYIFWCYKRSHVKGCRIVTNIFLYFLSIFCKYMYTSILGVVSRHLSFYYHLLTTWTRVINSPASFVSNLQEETWKALPFHSHGWMS